MNEHTQDVELNKILWFNFQDGCTAKDVEDAKAELNKAYLSQVLELLGNDEHVPIENRMSDPMQVREFNILIKVVYGRNKIRQELRTKFIKLWGKE